MTAVRRDVWIAVVALAAAALVVVGVYTLRPAPVRMVPGAVAVESRFVALGRAYLPQLGNAYAVAWEAGAKELDAGKPVSAAVGTVGEAWARERTALYDHVLTPELNKIVPEGAADGDVTAEQRAAMATAWRGLAKGLGGAEVKP